MSETKETPPPVAVVDAEPFTNPYTKTADLSAKLVCPISPADYNFVKLIRPGHGTFTSVIGTLWKKLVNELNSRNITDFSRINEFEHFIANCHIISHDEWQRYMPVGIGGRRFSDGTVDGIVSNTVASNVSGGKEKPCANVTSASTERTDLQGGVGKKGRRSGQGKAAEGTKQKSHVE